MARMRNQRRHVRAVCAFRLCPAPVSGHMRHVQVSAWPQPDSASKMKRTSEGAPKTKVVPYTLGRALAWETHFRTCMVTHPEMDAGAAQAAFANLADSEV
eukprot:11897711-Alexandrium_andersonii.AAC.1